MLDTLAGPCTFEETVRKSRFLTHAAPVCDPQAALAFIAARSDPTATHNCWAYRIGQVYRSSDDGEPAGTAGRPILQAIDGQQLDHVCVLVVRWFGGIKLGAGGLARAYAGGAAQCLRAGVRQPRVRLARVRLGCPFAELARLQARLAQWQAVIEEEAFDAAGARLTVSLPAHQCQALHDYLMAASRGQGRWEPLQET
ncbi:YigZ family protein [Orrella sp. JC864]|uniref:IMPACT family protein n=1 Tax=Orrella sp. JC864 TaxID=3120298 RepID=UPI003009BBE0